MALFAPFPVSIIVFEPLYVFTPTTSFSKCHTGRTCIYDTVGEDKWRVDIRSHRLLDVIEGVVKVKDLPVCKQEVGCEDCKMWDFL